MKFEVQRRMASFSLEVGVVEDVRVCCPGALEAGTFLVSPTLRSCRKKIALCRREQGKAGRLTRMVAVGEDGHTNQGVASRESNDVLVAEAHLATEHLP